MRVLQQQSLAAPAAFDGVGLHSGESVTLVVHPAAANTGIVFIRCDLLDDGKAALRDAEQLRRLVGVQHRAVIVARAVNVSRTRLGTTLTNPLGTSIATIEHLMAALALSGVDNALIAVSGTEVPILDGSARQFVDEIDQSGVMALDQTRTAIAPNEAFEVRDGDRFIRLEPGPSMSFDVAIDFDDPVIGHQSLQVSMDDRESRARLSRARTFCELKTVQHLIDQGLCQGGSLENSIVVDGGRMLNGENLRDPQEFVLHKTLDLLGDLALLGQPLGGRVTAFKPGHDINNRFCRALLDHLNGASHAKPGRFEPKDRLIAANQADDGLAVTT